ncbi:hypothetical protein [Ramlibacter rhizophilus]|uniref:DUF4142 domain-containing protein n=1 Tax=Ramlibacter rhizophilus TaxID=1781167 RepID=A0A4Z0BY78_9BURK|nr:hypothetical protein [Ramlibacter rhizophilus]TFZ04276.1 hypothetical protein EZ242_00505 [Ramlibacter rhizophilus]
MKFKSIALAVSMSLGAGFAGAQATPAKPPGAAPGGVLTASQSKTVENLQNATNRLHESIKAMENKGEGKQRHEAITRAQKALIDTQQAMLALPDEMRQSPAFTMSTTEYNESVKKLMQAAESLRKSVQAMAQMPAGEARNKAIQQVNQALVDTQAAMVLASVPATGQTGTMGAAGTGTAAKPAGETKK